MRPLRLASVSRSFRVTPLGAWVVSLFLFTDGLHSLCSSVLQWVDISFHVWTTVDTLARTFPMYVLAWANVSTTLESIAGSGISGMYISSTFWETPGSFSKQLPFHSPTPAIEESKDFRVWVSSTSLDIQNLYLLGVLMTEESLFWKGWCGAWTLQWSKVLSVSSCSHLLCSLMCTMGGVQ